MVRVGLEGIIKVTKTVQPGRYYGWCLSELYKLNINYNEPTNSNKSNASNMATHSSILACKTPQTGTR